MGYGLFSRGKLVAKVQNIINIRISNNITNVTKSQYKLTVIRLP